MAEPGLCGRVACSQSSSPPLSGDGHDLEESGFLVRRGDILLMEGEAREARAAAVSGAQECLNAGLPVTGPGLRPIVSVGWSLRVPLPGVSSPSCRTTTHCL